MTPSDPDPANRRSPLPVLGAAILIGGLVFGVGVWTRQQEGGTGAPGRPVVFLLSKEHAAATEPKDLESLAAFLKAETGLEIEIRVAPSPVTAIDSFDGAADLGLLNLFEYLLTRSEHGVEPRLQLLRRTGEPSYTGEILVRAESEAKSLQDLAGKKFGFVDAYSTSGFIFPARVLAEAKVRVIPEFTGGHPQSLEKLRQGQVEAIATHSGAAAGDARLRVLAATGTIPNEPIFFRRGMDASQKDRLTAALLKFASTPEGQKVLPRIAGATGLRPVEDGAYDDVRATIKASGKSLYEVVPEGMDVESRRRALSPVPW